MSKIDESMAHETGAATRRRSAQRQRHRFGRVAIVRWRGYLLTAGRYGKSILGVFLIATGAMVGTGVDKQLETILVTVSPTWLTDLTTQF